MVRYGGLMVIVFHSAGSSRSWLCSGQGHRVVFLGILTPSSSLTLSSFRSAPRSDICPNPFSWACADYSLRILSQSGLSGLTGSSWITDFYRCWTSPEVAILGLTKRSAAPGDEKASPRASKKMGSRTWLKWINFVFGGCRAGKGGGLRNGLVTNGKKLKITVQGRKDSVFPNRRNKQVRYFF